MSEEDELETLRDRLRRVTAHELDDPNLSFAKTIRLTPDEQGQTEGITLTDDDPAPSGTNVRAERASGYALEELIGRGGMGLVYRARQESLDRPVALKTSAATKDRYSGRQKSFIAEAAVTSRLEHPNIIPVHDLGQGEDGQTFFTMKLLEGRGWDRLLTDRDSSTPGLVVDPVASHLDILLDVTNALAFAHRQGFLHRDLKPENVLVGDFGEVVLTDWGLAARLDPDGDPRVPHVARARRMAGTPAYFPPEMALGEGDRQGAWTDVFGLGGLLHEILYGTPPNTGADLEAIVACALAGERNYDAEPTIPRELREICRRALDPDPQARFPDALAFRDALLEYRRHGESSRLTASAEAARIAIAETAGTPSSRAADDRRHEALALYRRALEVWPENEAAATGLAALRGEWAEEAASRGDLDLAAGLLESRGDPGDAERAREWRHERERRRQQRRSNRRLRQALLALLVLAALGLALGIFVVNGAREEAVRERLNYDRLATLSEARLLIERADREFWPPALARVSEMEDWMRRAQELLSRRPKLEALLAQVRARSSFANVPGPGEETRQRRVEVLKYDIEATKYNIGVLEELLVELPAPSPEKAAEIEAEIAGYKADLIALPRQLEALSQPVTVKQYRYAVGPDLFRGRTLEATLEALDILQQRTSHKAVGLVSIKRRCEEARRLEALRADPEFARRWEDAELTRALEDYYATLGQLDPRDDLVPLTQRTEAGMLRFAVLGTDPDQTPLSRMDEDFRGVVVILLPQGYAYAGCYGEEGLVAEQMAKGRYPLRSFFLAETETTVRQYAWLMGENPATFRFSRTEPDKDWPVESVTHNQAAAFSSRMRGVLPTCLRLEYAAREGRAIDWPDPDLGFKSLEGIANVHDQSSKLPDEFRGQRPRRVSWNDGFKRLAPVRTFRPTYWGFYNLFGNVCEWAKDWDPPTVPHDSGIPQTRVNFERKEYTDGENRFGLNPERRRIWGGAATNHPVPYSLPYHRRSAQRKVTNMELGFRTAMEH